MSTPRSRQPRGVTTGGQFATEARTETDVHLQAPVNPEQDRMMNLPPVEFDIELSELYEQRFKAHMRVIQMRNNIRRFAGQRPMRGGDWGGYWEEAWEKVAAIADSGTPKAGSARRCLDGLEEAEGEQFQLDVQVHERDDIFTARGGWTRAFLVDGGDGHVHSSMSCSTCNKGKLPTRFAWMTKYSGQSETEIVQDAGWRACTVCFPTAPVGDQKSLPTKMFTQSELDAQAERVRLAEAKGKRLAERIAKGLTPDGSELEVSWTMPNAPGWDLDPATGQRQHVRRDRTATQSFKTERTATTWLVDQICEDTWFTDCSVEQAEARAQIIEAIATKHGRTVDEVRTQINAKVAAKLKAAGRA